MRVTIIPEDGAVYKDGLCYSQLTWEGTPESVHALQWFTDTGWIELNDDNPNDNYKPANETNMQVLLMSQQHNQNLIEVK